MVQGSPDRLARRGSTSTRPAPPSPHQKRGEGGRGERGLAYVALGANLGDREATIRRAIDRLNELGTVEAVSSIYETDPVGYLDQPPFLNAVVRLRTALPPGELLTALRRIEVETGRVRTFRNAPRTLDLDLLLYDDLIHDDPELTLPHPRLHERAFVLVPLHDLAPDLVVPGRERSVRALLRDLGTVTGVRPYTPESWVL